MIHTNSDLNLRAIIQAIHERGIVEHVNHTPHAFFGIVLHMRHVGLHHIQPELRGHVA